MDKECEGCKLFEQGIGGENQEAHFGGCIDYPDWYEL